MDADIGLPPQYKPERLLGQTPRSSVYLVRRSDGAVVALKEIDLSVCGSTARAVVENLESLSNKLSHQNLVSCHNYTVNEETGYAYVELDYCPGGSLADLFKKQRRLIQQMPISQIWLIAAHLLSALSYLHFSYKHGGEVRCVTHGFITPESILLGPAGNAYLNIFSTDRITARLVEPVEQEIPLAERCQKDIRDLGTIFAKMAGLAPQDIQTSELFSSEPGLRCFLMACCGLGDVQCSSAAELLLFDDIQATLRAQSQTASRQTSSTSSKIPGQLWPPSSSLSGSASNAALFDKLDPLRRNKNRKSSSPDHDSLPVDVNVDDNSDTELILAVVRNDPDSVRRHLDQLGGRNVVGCTALMFAAAYDYIECARLLLDEVCMQDANGWTALMAAAQQGSEECVKLLVPHEACISDMNGFTALMAAAANGRLSCVHLLLEHEKGMKYVDGRTALMWGAFTGHLDCAKALFPSESAEKDNAGEYVLDWAQRGGEKAVIEYIRSKK
ncbi:Ankyrin repeat protein [Giardia duodenalis]|uniref:Ankyrin repeat protein n=1 Tax=Giardia intestinalis TaxID=5741 RepID=V6TLV1_GIAIN|nr:Ankyrin repeat protein [Giardia intestinalis]